MDTILTKATQSADDKKKEKISYIEAIILMAVFTALFLGTEYLFVCRFFCSLLYVHFYGNLTSYESTGAVGRNGTGG